MTDGKHSSTIGLVCRDKLGRVKHIDVKAIENYPFLVVKVVAILEAVTIIIQKRVYNVIIESDSQLAVRAITGYTKVPSQISNMLRMLKFRLKLLEFKIYIM